MAATLVALAVLHGAALIALLLFARYSRRCVDDTPAGWYERRILSAAKEARTRLRR